MKRSRVDGSDMAGAPGPDPVMTTEGVVPTDVDVRGGAGMVNPESMLAVEKSHELFQYNQVEEYMTSFKSATPAYRKPVTPIFLSANHADSCAAAAKIPQGSDEIPFSYTNQDQFTCPQFFIWFTVQFLKSDNAKFPAGESALEAASHTIGLPQPNIGHNMWKDIKIIGDGTHNFVGDTESMYHIKAWIHNLLTTKKY